MLALLFIHAAEGDDTMSAVASDYVYLVKIKKGAEKPEPTISAETLKQYKADVAKYLTRKDGR